MTLEEFKVTISQDNPPPGLNKRLEALWYAAKGEWNTAHRLVQSLSDAEAAWVHAYLHREEGDVGNAGYWYRRAGRSAPDASLEKEWGQIVQALL